MDSGKNPLTSVADWCDGVGHHGRDVLYAALVVEEAGELAACVSSDDFHVSSAAENAEQFSDELSRLLRKRSGSLAPKVDALDAALDTAWVALCLAYQLVGNDRDRLAAAWAELHRSNVTDKQVGGVFVKDETGKVKKPAGWTPPDFERFLP